MDHPNGKSPTRPICFGVETTYGFTRKGKPPDHPFRIRPLDMERGIQRFAAVGTTRLAYSSEDKQGRRYAMEMMRELGLAVRIDAAGNIFGRRAGTSGGPPILFGSHIDTVRDAGRYDGVLGVVSGIECIRALCEMNHQTEHPLELVIFANEEGQNYSGLLGSRAMVGDLGSEELKQDRRRRESAQRGYSSDRRQPGRSGIFHFGARQGPRFLEVHVEQGGELDGRGIPIGVVEGISGIQQTDVIVSGTANHSGTTGWNRARMRWLPQQSSYGSEADRGQSRDAAG